RRLDARLPARSGRRDDHGRAAVATDDAPTRLGHGQLPARLLAPRTAVGRLSVLAGGRGFLRDQHAVAILVAHGLVSLTSTIRSSRRSALVETVAAHGLWPAMPQELKVAMPAGSRRARSDRLG